MADITTVVSLICFGIVVLCYVCNVFATVADCWRYINSGLIDEAEFAYEPAPPKGKRIRKTRTAGRHVERRPARTSGTQRPRTAQGRPSWAYTTML